MKDDKNPKLSDLPGQVPEDVAARLAGGGHDPKTSTPGSDGQPIVHFGDEGDGGVWVGTGGMNLTFVPKTQAAAKAQDTSTGSTSWVDWAFGKTDTKQPGSKDATPPKSDGPARGIDLGHGVESNSGKGGDTPSGERTSSLWSWVGLGGGDETGKSATAPKINKEGGEAPAKKAEFDSKKDDPNWRPELLPDPGKIGGQAKPAQDVKSDDPKAPKGPIHVDLEADPPGKIKLTILDPKAKAAGQNPEAEPKPSVSMSGEIGKEVGKLPATFVKEAAASLFNLQADLAKQAAKAAGTSVSSGKLGLDASDKPGTVTTTETTSTSKVTTSTTQGSYSGAYAGSLEYNSKALGGSGVVVATGYEGGWTSKTIVKEDRFGALVTVTEGWADATFSAGASAGADRNAGGAQMNVKIKTEFSANDGFKISTTDLATGATYTLSGQRHFDASAGAEAKAMITWERVSLKLGAEAGVSASASIGEFWGDKSGAGHGYDLYAKANAQAKAKLGANASWNPVDGYTVGIKPGAEVDFGVALGLEPKLATAVSDLALAADACFGKIGAHADIDLGYKNGVFAASVDIGGALGLGFNLKLGTKIDVLKYGQNVSYWYGTTPVGAAFASTGQFNPVNVALNPTDLAGAGFMGLFVNAPKHEEVDTPYLDHWDPPAAELDSATKSIISGSGHVDQATAMKFFGYMTVKYSKLDILKSFIDHNPGNAEFFKNYNKFLDRDPTDPQSFTFTPGKSPVHDISDRCEKWFPGSDNPLVKSVELTFKKLPDRFYEAFEFVTNSKGEQEPDPKSAFAMFGGLSLVQYLSIQAFEKIARMDDAQMRAYLQSKACDYLTDDAKTKLTEMWGNPVLTTILGNPYENASAHVKLNAYGANLFSTTYEAKFWDLSKSPGTSKDKQMQFDVYAAGFAKEFFKTTKLVWDPQTSGGAWVEAPSGNAPIADATLAPKSALWQQSLVNFKGIPFADNGWRLIDLTAAKEGKIGLKDHIYQYTVDKMDGYKSPQAIFQFLSGPKSNWIADDGVSRAVLFDVWWEKHKNGDWSTGEDPDAVSARHWLEQNRSAVFSRTALP